MILLAILSLKVRKNCMNLARFNYIRGNQFIHQSAVSLHKSYAESPKFLQHKEDVITHLICFYYVGSGWGVLGTVKPAVWAGCAFLFCFLFIHYFVKAQGHGLGGDGGDVLKCLNRFEIWISDHRFGRGGRAHQVIE